jgi:hypothetical protein
MNLEPEVADRLVNALRVGSYLEVACRAVGIEVEDLEVAARENEELRARIERARAEAELAHIGLISRAAREGTWLAAAWLLERLYPDRYGRPAQREAEKPPPPIVGSDSVDDLAGKRDARRAGVRL